ncbi:hypothetical protein BH24ACT2_BH24ACT2_00710 [soil metagenome]
MGEDDGWRLVVIVLDGIVEVTVTRTDRRPDLTLIEELARLRLARRVGHSVRLRDPCLGLGELLDLVGLADLFDGRPGSALEAGWETERGEQLRTEKVVEPGDPWA